ncbi:hypothetical protein BDV93DRAFT_511369 [Ceratobasidium sp. AG-I]|nr:hypothetical protein BDV93DRAFT_511369 [Ceratobasidium sp. AG-I]
MSRASREAIMNGNAAALKAGCVLSNVFSNRTVETLQNRSVRRLVKVHQPTNNPDLMLSRKRFEAQGFVVTTCPEEEDFDLDSAFIKENSYVTVPELIGQVFDSAHLGTLPVSATSTVVDLYGSESEEYEHKCPPYVDLRRDRGPIEISRRVDLLGDRDRREGRNGTHLRVQPGQRGLCPSDGWFTTFALAQLRPGALE